MLALEPDANRFTALSRHRRELAQLGFDRQRLGFNLAGGLVEKSDHTIIAPQSQLVMIGPDRKGEDGLRLSGLDPALRHASRIPRLQHVVLTRGIERFAVGGIMETCDRSFVGENGMYKLAARLRGLPYTDALVDTRGGEMP